MRGRKRLFRISGHVRGEIRFSTSSGSCVNAFLQEETCRLPSFALMRTYSSLYVLREYRQLVRSKNAACRLLIT